MFTIEQGLLIFNELQSRSVEGTLGIQVFKLEETGFWSQSWEKITMKTLGPGIRVHTFNARIQIQADLWIQGQPGTEQILGKEELK